MIVPTQPANHWPSGSIEAGVEKIMDAEHLDETLRAAIRPLIIQQIYTETLATAWPAGNA